MIPLVDWGRIYRVIRVLEAMTKNNPGSLAQLHNKVGGGESTNRMVMNMLLEQGILTQTPLEGGGSRRYVTCTPRAKELLEVYEKIVEEFSFAIQ